MGTRFRPSMVAAHFVASRILASSLARRLATIAAVIGAAVVAVTISFLASPQTSMPPPEVTLEPATFADLPGWRGDDHLAAFKTFLRSCETVIKTASAANGARLDTSATAAELAEVCRAAMALASPTGVTARAFFEARFVPHRVIQTDGEGFLTGYYEPVLEGSRTREGRFQTPIYRRPPDLVNVVSEADRASMSNGLSHMRKTAAGMVPYATRAEIERGALAGQGLELLYLEDPVDAFFMQVQGSGRIKLRDGTSVRINYDGKNGYPYTSVGRYLVAKGLMQADTVTLQSLRKFLHDDPDRGRKVMWQNESFIFFRELVDAEGPMGALSVTLTPGRSLAVDTQYHRLGVPVYVTAPTLTALNTDGSGFSRLMVAQDVGSAIKGPQRGDIYLGSGDKAGRLAGTTKHPGSFFVLLPASARNAAQTDERLPQRSAWPKKTKKAER